MIVDARNYRRRIPKTALVNGCEYRVVPNKFWIRFNKGIWEPDLRAFFQRYISPEKKVLDIGGWFGPSVLTACSFHPRKVEVVEANPKTFKILQANIEKNNLGQLVALHHLCLSDKTGETVNFGAMDRHVPHSAINGIGGNGYVLKTVSFTDFLKKINLRDFNIIKIDIEGGERFLLDGLRYLSAFSGLHIFLALHPPFWPDKETVAYSLLEIFKEFDVFTAGEEFLSHSALKKAMLSNAKTHYPNKTGRFFDVILKSKSQ